MPPTGQTWTTLGKMRSAKGDDGGEKKYRNVFEQVEYDEKVWEIWTEPKVSRRVDCPLREGGATDEMHSLALDRAPV